MKKPGVKIGAIAGLLLTAPLLAVFYFGDQIAGLPFIPFDVFDWVARVLPGGVVTFGIDQMVNLLITLNLDVAQTAKAAEQLMAISGLLITGIVVGAVFFTILNRRSTKPDNNTPGLILGAIVGAPVLLISLNLNQTATASPFFGAIWILGAFLVWGAAYSWAYDNLLVEHAPAPVSDAALVAAQEMSVQRLSRREFLIRLGGTTAAITVVGAGLGSVLNANAPLNSGVATSGVAPAAPIPVELPNTSTALEPALGTRPEYTPLERHYQIDISARPPIIEESLWTLPITGHLDNPLELSLDDIRNNYAPMEQYVTLSCISNRVGGNLIGTTRWSGISMKALMAEVAPKEGATHVRITSQDGFFEIVSLDLINSDEDVMLAYEWDGRPLLRKHGFPLRIFIPDRYGMKQPKWITGMEIIAQWEPGYWVERGWDRDALVNMTSVIDTVAIDDMDVEANTIPIGGIAYAGAREIMKVEVKVDDGEWTEAQLRTPLSKYTWSIWRYDWPYESGQHTFYVRCFDGDGTPQTTSVAPNRPSGATGIHQVTERV